MSSSGGVRNLSVEEQRILDAANKERAEIVEKYRLGRDEGAEIDPWEDPEFEVYAVTDRYGFLHNAGIPEDLSRVSSHKVRLVELERTQKWLKMTNKWEQYYPSEMATRRVYKGIPEPMRGLVWSLLLELPRIRKEQSRVYEDMKAKAHRWSPDIRQIDLDVNRTYRNHIMFRRRYDVKQQALFHVLAAYSMYNTEVGYCQGMSQLAALLLMYLNEEDAFWALSALFSHKRHTMHGVFIPGFPKMFRFQKHHNVILEKLLPKVKAHLDKHSLSADIYTIKWFMQCFLDRVPFHLALRLWDIFLLDGDKLLVAMSYNLLKMHQRHILKMGMEDLFQFFQGTLEKDFGYDDDQTIESLLVCMSELNRLRLALPPPPSDASELPSRPFGLFVPPSVEQIIGRRTLETESELLRGRRATFLSQTNVVHRLSISVPPDGGPAYLEGLPMAAGTQRRALANGILEQVRESTVEGAGSPHTVGDRRPRVGIVRQPATDVIDVTSHGGGSRYVRGPDVNGSIQGNGVSGRSGAGRVKSPVGSGEQRKSRVGGKISAGRTQALDSSAPQEYGATVRF